MNENKLIDKAIEASMKSYSPYSNFKVGAALLCRDKSVFYGANVENASYSLTICAERSAFLNAISDDKREFDAIAIVGGKDGKIVNFCPPCGACRQFMSEFCEPDFKIILFNGESTKIMTLGELFPAKFDL